jgi:hypothetical protein
LLNRQTTGALVRPGFISAERRQCVSKQEGGIAIAAPRRSRVERDLGHQSHTLGATLGTGGMGTCRVGPLRGARRT